MSNAKAIKTTVRPKVGRIKKIIKNAAKSKTLIEGYLTESSHDSCNLADGTCSNVGRCAMGELLYRIGYSLKELNTMSAGGAWGQDVYQDLWEAYRIDTKDVNRIIGTNDSAASIATRETRLLKLVDNFKSAPRVDPFKTRLDDSGAPIGPLADSKEIKMLKKFNLYDEYENQGRI